jgi:hypothetical protein
LIDRLPPARAGIPAGRYRRGSGWLRLSVVRADLSPVSRQRRGNRVVQSFLSPRRIFANGMLETIPLRRLFCTMLKLMTTR